MNELSLESLAYFVVLAECGHFGEAANRLYITQQGLSMSIKRLEARLGVSLFLRQGRRRQLSPAGRQLLLKAHVLISQAQALEDYFQPVSAMTPCSLLRFAAPMFPRLPVMPVIRRYLDANPLLRIECEQEMLPIAMETALLAGELDCAFYQQPPESSFLSWAVVSIRQFLVVANPEFAQSSWDACDYIRYLPLFRPYTNLFWPPEMHDLPVVAEADHDTALHLCSQGKGALYLPESLVRHRLRSKQMVQLAPPPFQHELVTYLIWNRVLDPVSLAGRFVADCLARSEVSEVSETIP